MLHVTVENKYGQQLNLTNSADYDVLQVTGLTLPAATINTKMIANKDGECFNSSRIEMRNITMLIRPKGNIEKSRINLYKYFRSKDYIKLYLSNGTRKTWIEGYVESGDADLYVQNQTIPISIICNHPHFKAIDEVCCEFSTASAMFEFPFSITSSGQVISTQSTYATQNVQNIGDAETGALIELYASGRVLEPTINNSSTNESFTLNHEFDTNDIVKIDMRSGKKSIILIRNGVETNILNQMDKTSRWFKIIPGDNLISYTTLYGAENLKVKLTIQPEYLGV